MNKTIIININGIIFHIEEDAYEVLQTYMISVKKHFGYSPDSNEIVSDIENRIAEMFNERITPQKAVITMEDVNEVTAQMGRISDFEDFDEKSTEYANDYDDYSYDSERRGLFRDPDDKVLGGVCSGLGHYFEIEAKWVRLILILLFLFGGMGLLVYIILWIVIPLARTRADKMSMRGEAANIHNFKRNFDEEMEGLRRNFTEAGQRISPGLKKTAKKTGVALEQGASLVVKIIGILVIIASGIGLIAGFIALFIFLGVSNGGYFGDDFAPALFVDPTYYQPLVWASFIAGAIPLFALILLSIRMISSIKISSYLGYSLLILWIISIGFVIYYSTLISVDHSFDGKVVETETLKRDSVYFLTMNDVTAITKRSNPSSRVKRRVVDITDGEWSKQIRPRIYINKLTFGDSATVNKNYSAEGRNFEVATARAQQIIYNVAQEDRKIIFDSHGSIGKGELIRDQEIWVELNVPEGTRLIIDENVQQRIYNLPDDDVDSDDFDRRSYYPSEWIMTSKGLQYISKVAGRSTPLPVDSLATQNDTTQAPIDTLIKN